MDRKSRDDYEARATAIQQHIRLLVDELQRHRDLASRTRPSATDSLHGLLQLHAEIRPVTQLLRSHMTSYLRATTEWDNAIREFNLHEDRSSWAQAMRHQHHLFFHGLSLSSMSLDFQFSQLLQDFMGTLDDIESFIRRDSSPADAYVAAPSMPINVQAAPVAAHSAAAGTPRASTDPTGTHSVAEGDRRASQPATRRSSSGFRPAPADHFYRNEQSYEATTRSTARDVPRSTSNRSAAAHPPAQQSSNRPTSTGRVTTFVSSSLRRGHYGTTGIMSRAEEDISNAIPLAWQPTINSGPLYSTAETAGSAAHSAALPEQDYSLSARQRDPGRTVHPEHKRRLQQVLANCATNGSGPTTAPSSRPLTVGAYGTPLQADATPGTTQAPALAPTVGTYGTPLQADATHGTTQAPASVPADYGVDFGRENSSTFYRNAHFKTRASTTGIAPPSLVLRELPLTPFDGDIRLYPAFRNRFLDIVEAQRNLEPRHKLQYLLQYLRGEPLRIADGFPISDASYFSIIDQLEERYGGTNRIRKVLVNDLLGLQPPGTSTASLRQFYDQAFRVHTTLQQLGTDTQNQEFLSDVLMGKLSAQLRLEVIRHPDYQRQKTVSSVLKALCVHLRLLEEAADTGFTWSSQPSAQPKRGSTTLWSGPPGRFGQSTSRGNNSSSNAADADFSYVADFTDHACEYCGDLRHPAVYCNVYSTVNRRLRRLRELKRCFLCLQEGHCSRSCPQQFAPLQPPGSHVLPHQKLRPGRDGSPHQRDGRSDVQPAPVDTKTKQPCGRTREEPNDDLGDATPPSSRGFPANMRTEGKNDDGAQAPRVIPAVLRLSNEPGSAIRQTGRPRGGPVARASPNVRKNRIGNRKSEIRWRTRPSQRSFEPLWGEEA